MKERELLKKMILAKFGKKSNEFELSESSEKELKKNYVKSLATQIVNLSESSTFATSLNANILICDLLELEDVKNVLSSALKKDSRTGFGNLESEIVSSRAFTEKELEVLK